MRGRVATSLEKRSSPLSSSESNDFGGCENFRRLGVGAAEESNGEGLARDEAMVVALLIEVADGVSGVEIDIKRQR